MHFKLKKFKDRWSLYFYDQGKLSYVREKNWPIGLAKSLSFEQAGGVVKSLNAHERIRKEELTKLKITQRILTDQEKRCAWLPDDVVSHFDRIYLKPRESKPGFDKLLGQWKLVKAIILDINLDPQDWALEPLPFYDWWKGHPTSLDYMTRVMRLLNRYGYIYARKRGGSFLPVSPPTHQQRTELVDNFNGSKKSLPVLEDHLPDFKQKLSPEHYNWVYIAFAFGLRPEEVDLLKCPIIDSWKNWWFESEVLVIYQPKLTRVLKRDRYKRIPIFTEYQKLAKAFIESGMFERPSVRRVRATFPEGVSLYGARHGFTRYMEKIGQPMNKIQKWLGHRSIKTTEQYYRDHGLLATPEE